MQRLHEFARSVGMFGAGRASGSWMWGAGRNERTEAVDQPNQRQGQEQQGLGLDLEEGLNMLGELAQRPAIASYWDTTYIRQVFIGVLALGTVGFLGYTFVEKLLSGEDVSGMGVGMNFNATQW